MACFGSRLKELRIARGLTLDNVAKSTGTSKQALFQIEGGLYIPNPQLMVALADFFDVSLDYLFGRKPLL